MLITITSTIKEDKDGYLHQAVELSNFGETIKRGIIKYGELDVKRIHALGIEVTFDYCSPRSFKSSMGGCRFLGYTHDEIMTNLNLERLSSR